VKTLDFTRSIYSNELLTKQCFKSGCDWLVVSAGNSEEISVSTQQNIYVIYYRFFVELVNISLCITTVVQIN